MARILHIEDDPRNRLLVRKLLASSGHEVVDAADGLEGVRAALSARPDLVLVDLNIPGLDGYEVTLRLRSEASLASVPIIAITAEGDRDTSLAVGCNGFLRKPIDARNFSGQIEAFLRGHRERAHSTHEESGEMLRKQGGLIVARLEQKVDELQKANEQLREVERLRTEFYRNVSHELATPLTPIVGYLKMLQDLELGPLQAPQQKALRAMSDCVRRLRATLDSLVDVTALETGAMRFFHKEYDFAASVRRALIEFVPRFEERRITVLSEIPNTPLPGLSDPDRLERALGQILDNAAKFVPDGAIVGILVRVVGDRYECVIADTGAGIAEELRSRVFDPFYQVDGSATRSHGGVGVGLAVARQVARGLGGDVRILDSVTVEGMYLRGAVLSLTVRKRALASDGVPRVSDSVRRPPDPPSAGRRLGS